jgi:hypothetical protein
LPQTPLAGDGVTYAEPLARLPTMEVLFDFPVVPGILSPSQQSMKIGSGVFQFVFLLTSPLATRLLR